MEIMTLKITGTKPLLQNNPAGALNRGETTIKVKKIPTAEEEAERGAYKNDDGTLYHPAQAFRSAILGAAKGRKIGKAFATTVVKGSVFVTHDRADLYDPETGEALSDYEIDERSVVIQRNRVLRARPLHKKWACDIEVEYNDEFITGDQVQFMLSLAGESIGIGDYRPLFGRFKVSGQE